MNIIENFFRRNELKSRNVRKGKFAQIDSLSTFEGENYIGSYSRIANSKLGYASYVSSKTIIKNTNIGRFVSIGSNFKMVSGQHPTNEFISSHPAFYTNNNKNLVSFVNKQKYKEHRFSSDESDVQLEIGNDVWIGDDVLVMEGVKIGDGSIVAAGAVVTKEVPPYAIVGGVPAKVIKYRFTNEKIERLQNISWWDWPIEKIKKNAEKFEDVNSFISQFFEGD